MDDLFAILLPLQHYFSHIRTQDDGRVIMEGRQDDGRVIMEGRVGNKPRLQLKRFPCPGPGGNRTRDRLIIKPALNPLSYRAYRRKKRQNDSQPARQTDNQRERMREKRERHREGEINTILLTLQQLHCWSCHCT